MEASAAAPSGANGSQPAQSTGNENLQNTQQPGDGGIPNQPKKTQRAKAGPKSPKVEESGEKGPKPGYKLFKVDGSEYEVDEPTFMEAARKSLTAEKRIYEANQRTKAAEEAQRKADEISSKWGKFESMSPEEQFDFVLQRAQDPNASKAVRAKAEQWLVQQIQMDEASPEKRAQIEAERRAKELEEKLNAKEKAEKEAQYKQEYKFHQDQVQKDIIGVVDASGLPATPWNIKRISDLLLRQGEIAKKNPAFKMTNEQMAEFIKQDTIENTGALYGGLADGVLKARESGNNEEILRLGKTLVENLPEGLAKALRIYDLTKHVSGQPMNAAPQKMVDTPKATETKQKGGAYEYGSMDAWIEDRRRKAEELQRSWKKS